MWTPIAEFERGRIGERVRSLIGRGNWPGGRTPYGYRWLAGKRKWEVIPEEAQVVQRVYDLYVNKKLGIHPIVATLNGDGLSTRGGAPWRYSLVHAILTHPGYRGQHQIGVTMPPLMMKLPSDWHRRGGRRFAAYWPMPRAGCCRGCVSAANAAMF